MKENVLYKRDRSPIIAFGDDSESRVFGEIIPITGNNYTYIAGKAWF
jgi:hypothetical protein